ncbi:FAD-binding oxidoreductase [Myroides sp. NP-2]|uniref:FAD-binding oxidoreductase n=1 Tax=Myroides sp. NP-2 TaxID=2759945 RepID=UPI002105EFAF|nr:FAD-binding oxidoreductase [Myroides sp. NP-2]
MVTNLFRRVLDFIGITPYKLPLAQVSAITTVTPSVKVIQLKGDFKNLQFSSGSYLSLKLNYIQTRKYTISQLDKDNGTLEFIAYLHPNGGTGQHFMHQLKMGDAISMNSLHANSNYLAISTASFIFFGDETSLGLAYSLCQKWKEKQYKYLFLFELDEENKTAPLALGIEQSLVFPKKKTFRSERLISQLDPIVMPEWKEAVFLLTGDAKSIQIFRKVIKDKTTSKVYTRGYWVEGIEGL